MKTQKMTGNPEEIFEETINWARENLGMTDGEIARAIGTSRAQLFRYEEYGSGEVTERMKKVLHLWLIKRMTEQVIGKDDAEDWIRSPNETLDGETPLHFLRYGSFGPVTGALADRDVGES